MAQTFGKYFQKIYSKQPLSGITRKYYPCPGNFLHRKIIGNHRAKLLFRKYCKYSLTVHRLYWRSHQQEYTELLRIVNKKINE